MTDIMAQVREYTKSPHVRLQAMWDALLYIEHERIAGDIAECGVWKGGNIILARKLAPRRFCWLYDTFDGMTAPTDVDVTRGGFNRIKNKVGKDKVSLDEVRANLEKSGVLNDGLLRFVIGPVEETLTYPKNIPHQLALLRLDTDWYASTKIEMEMLYPRLSPGGILIIDDYGHWMGCKKAVDEYFNYKTPKMQSIDYSCHMLTKPF